MSRNLVLAMVFGVLLVMVAVLLYLNFFAPPPGSRQAVVTPAPADERPAPAPSVAAAGPGPAPTPAGPAVRTTVSLYFQGADVGLLFPEEREIDGTVAAGHDRARLVLQELIAGPRKDLLPTIPPGTQLREVYFDARGVAYADFTHELRDAHPGGTAEELMTVDSIVSTLARNVPEVQSVQFLIEGRPIESLAGHVDLSRPLRPTSERIAETP